ncbi:sensor histidine kinase [Streptomyces noursei]|uniref:sensor histidine kinase n=1 Tax=Streptomyces noursei TaxID=1971 RepID=UPI00045F0953|nr:ATP-binding protein [Streptomyces noursei]AIA08034.1 nitrate/nitrite sensor protein [Streptomyces noursei]
MTRDAMTLPGLPGVWDRPPTAEDDGPPGRETGPRGFPERAPSAGERSVSADADRPADAGAPLAPADRQGLSRELHDCVAHAIVVGLNSIELSEFYAADGRPERARDKRTDAVRFLQQALHTVKELATRLRTPGTDHRLAAHPPAPVPVSAADVSEVYLILREALGNALAHAGADDITISLRTRNGMLLADVVDDGNGLDSCGREGSPGLGLASMKERAALLGGSLHTSPGPQGGTRITVTVPLVAQ